MEQVRQTPKCFRQIGHPDAGEHVYIEDYVKSYIERVSADLLEDGCFLALYGAAGRKSGCREWYLDGAARLSFTLDDLNPDMGTALREEICTLREKHFPESAFLGWFLQMPDFFKAEQFLYQELGKGWFSDQELCVCYYKPYEEQLTCAYMHDGSLENLSGYYIYYEKNLPMQNYMVDQDAARQAEPVKEASVVAIRAKFRQQQSEEKPVCAKPIAVQVQKFLKKKRRRVSKLTLVTICLTVLFLLMLGSFIYLQRDQMDQAAKAVAAFSKELMEKGW